MKKTGKKFDGGVGRRTKATLSGVVTLSEDLTLD